MNLLLRYLQWKVALWGSRFLHVWLALTDKDMTTDTSKAPTDAIFREIISWAWWQQSWRLLPISSASLLWCLFYAKLIAIFRMRKQIQEKCVGGSSGCNSVRKRSPATQRGRRLPIGRLDCGWSEQRSDWSVGGNKGAATATTTPQGNKVWGCQSLHWGHRASSSASYIVTISITLVIINLFIIITDNIMLPISHVYALFVAELKTTLWEPICKMQIMVT